ncbi:hypothetical protein BS78_08G046900 [Paspalum vaginatum]|nr:hypothetical protein BS78_08G046900 [Paspalum vaginatum]
MRSLGLKHLASLLELTSLEPKPIKKKKTNKEDSGSKYDAEEDRESDGDLKQDEVQWVRGNNIGRGLDRMSRSKKGKLALVIEEGRTRPRSPMIAENLLLSDEIEHKIADPIEDGEKPNLTEVVSNVLVHKTKKNRFLCNVGIQNKTGTSNAMRRELEAELVREKQGSNELSALRMQEAETARAKHDEEILKKQAETDELLKRLMSMIPNFTSMG